jgi:hypothetical protein
MKMNLESVKKASYNVPRITKTVEVKINDENFTIGVAQYFDHEKAQQALSHVMESIDVYMLGGDDFVTAIVALMVFTDIEFGENSVDNVYLVGMLAEKGVIEKLGSSFSEKASTELAKFLENVLAGIEIMEKGGVNNAKKEVEVI